MIKTEELEQQVMLQEMETMNLMAEIEQMRPSKKPEISEVSGIHSHLRTSNVDFWRENSNIFINFVEINHSSLSSQ